MLSYKTLVKFRTLIKFYCPHPLLPTADCNYEIVITTVYLSKCDTLRFALATGLGRTGEQASAWDGHKQCNYPRSYCLTPLKESGTAFGLHLFSLSLCGQGIKPLNAKMHAWKNQCKTNPLHSQRSPCNRKDMDTFKFPIIPATLRKGLLQSVCPLSCMPPK